MDRSPSPSPGFRLPQTNLAGTAETTTTTTTGGQQQQPPSFDFDALMRDSGQSMAQALFAFPDLSFDMPAVPSQAPAAIAEGTTAGGGAMLTDPALLETNMANWSTWDEFVLDTYANSTPKSGSGGSEGS
ncbi:hypothetical protein ONZ43_g1587 [Nemania bipapillata]|uniref:Uncharacterized protein n=1 Tax=Nemania bipapillata TaxID=110536 RepID=A0ACC2J3X7_9PEZI|nr:hypothetical protein ONZ43_g1587 [Nemania bipapillata]